MIDSPSLFSPPALTDADKALRQALMLGQCPWFSELCRLLPTPLVLVNADDVVVLANPALQRLAGLPPGLDPAGCAVDPDELTRLGLVARPLRACGEAFRIFTGAAEGPHAGMQGILLHDLLNTAGSVRGLSEVMAEARPEDVPALSASVRDLAGQLFDELASHRDLAAAERGELRVEARTIDAAAALGQVAKRFRNHPAAADRQLVVVPGPGGGELETDPVLLGRILGNMVKNALEAIPEGAVVTLDSGRDETGVWFRVHNAGAIAPDHLPRVFERSFSTKGKGRGLGAWGMKVLAESYLRGRVAVTSDAARGTSFTLTLPCSGS